MIDDVFRFAVVAWMVCQIVINVHTSRVLRQHASLLHQIAQNQEGIVKVLAKHAGVELEETS